MALPLTTRSMITGALQLINVIQANEVPSPSDMNTAVYSLDSMIDSWSNNRLMIYNIVEMTFPVTGKTTYTLGSANDKVGSIIAFDLTSMTGGSSGLYNTAGSGYNSGGTNTFYNVPFKPAIIDPGTGGTTRRATISNPQPFDSGEMVQVAVSDGGAGYQDGIGYYHTIPGTLDQINGPGAGAISGFDVIGGQVLPWEAYNMVSYGNIEYTEPINIFAGPFDNTTDPFQAAYIEPTPGYQSSYGTGATGNVTVQNGVIIDVQIVLPGIGYNAGDILTVDPSYLGGGTPTNLFSVNVLEAQIQTDWILERPMAIEEMYARLNAGSPQQLDILVQPLTDAQYASISVKNTTSTFAFSFYDDRAYPTRNITLFPIPGSGSEVVLYLRLPLMDLTNLDAPVNFPPGYERAFRYNLAVELAPIYGKTVTPEIAARAAASIKDLERLNSVPRFIKGDSGMNRNGRNRFFNWITGNFWNFGN